MEIDYKILGERLKKSRKQKGYTQAQLAEILDISEEYLSRMEKGNTKLSLARLIQICEILQVSICEIITGVGKQTKEYLYKDFIEILEICTPEKRKLIYNMAILVAKIKT